ncbi:MAG: HAD family hydrolase [Atopobiaceae bacterium]
MKIIDDEVFSSISDRPLIIFDFDGTLADSKPTIVATATKVLLEFGMKPEELGDVSRLVGPPFPYAYELVYGFSRKDAEEITRRYREIYRNIGPAGCPLFSGILELLEDLKAAGKTLAVASSKNQPLLMACIEEQKLVGVLDFVQGKTSDALKSKTQLIESVLAHCGLEPHQALMVGDRSFDAEGAAGAHVACVGVTYAKTGDVAELEDAGACVVAESVDELRHVLLAPTRH